MHIVNGKHLDGQAAVPSDFSFRLDNVLFPVHSAIICRLSVTISQCYEMTVENSIDGSNIIDIPVLTTPVTQESVELILKMLYAPHSMETNVPVNYDVFGGAMEFARWLYIQEVYQFIIRYWDADICSKREEFIMTWGIVKLVSAITTYDEWFPRSMKDLEHYIGASASHTSFDDRVRLHEETSISAKFWKDVLFSSWILPVTPRQECKRLSICMGDILKIANLVSSSLKDKLNDITTTISSDNDAFQPSRLHPGMEAWYSQAADALDTMFHEFNTSAIMETVPREYRIDILFVQFDVSLCQDGMLPSNFDFETVGKQCSVTDSFFRLRRMMSSHAFSDNLDAAFVVIVRDSHDRKLTVCLQQRQGRKNFPGYFFFNVCKFECDWGCFDYSNYLVQDPMATLRQYLSPSKSGEGFSFDTQFWGAYIDDQFWPDGPSFTIPLAGHIQLWNKSNKLIPIFAWRMAVTEFLPQDDDDDAGRRRNFFGTFGTLRESDHYLDLILRGSQEDMARTVERERLMKVIYLYADQHIFNLS